MKRHLWGTTPYCLYNTPSFDYQTTWHSSDYSRLTNFDECTVDNLDATWKIRFIANKHLRSTSLGQISREQVHHCTMSNGRHSIEMLLNSQLHGFVTHNPLNTPGTDIVTNCRIHKKNKLVNFVYLEICQNLNASTLAHPAENICSSHVVVDSCLATFLQLARMEHVLSVTKQRSPQCIISKCLSPILAKFHHLCPFHNCHQSPHKIHNPCIKRWQRVQMCTSSHTKTLNPKPSRELNLNPYQRRKNALLRRALQWNATCDGNA